MNNTPRFKLRIGRPFCFTFGRCGDLTCRWYWLRLGYIGACWTFKGIAQ